MLGTKIPTLPLLIHPRSSEFVGHAYSRIQLITTIKGHFDLHLFSTISTFHLKSNVKSGDIFSYLEPIGSWSWAYCQMVTSTPAQHFKKQHKSQSHSIVQKVDIWKVEFCLIISQRSLIAAWSPDPHNRKTCSPTIKITIAIVPPPPTLYWTYHTNPHIHTYTKHCSSILKRYRYPLICCSAPPKLLSNS